MMKVSDQELCLSRGPQFYTIEIYILFHAVFPLMREYLKIIT